MLQTAIAALFAYLLSLCTAVASTPTANPWARTGAPCSPFAQGHSKTYTVDPATLAKTIMTAKSGDTIYLKNGDYGVVAVAGKNSDFVTLAAAPGAHPLLRRLNVGGGVPTSHWRFVGLTIAGYGMNGFLGKAEWSLHPALVQLNDADNLILERNTISSQPNDYAWHPIAQGQEGEDSLSSGVLANDSYCVSISSNHIFNVFNGIMAGGSQTGNVGKYFLLVGNVIDNFAGDGIEHFGSHVSIEHNVITNGHDICENQCIHNDGIQGWAYNGRLDVTNEDVTISGNTIIVQTVANLLLPADALQGITIFDGRWKNVRVTNNIVVVDAYHGISLYGVQNAVVMNNSVVGTNPERVTWIMINNRNGDGATMTYRSIVRNNVARAINVGQPGKTVLGVTVDHNLLFEDARSVFTKVDGDKCRYDLHLAAGSAAIGRGSVDDAPPYDIEGTARSAPFDIGAYAYRAH